MTTRAALAAVITMGAGLLVGCGGAAPENQPAATPAPAAATEASRGGQDQTGPYTVAPNWPKPLSQLPGHEKWTWGAMQGVFAESPNRVFILQRGELPELPRPAEMPVPSFGPSLSFPVGAVPFRNASTGINASPGNQGPDGFSGWKGKLGVDARWEHCLLVVDAEGNITESWTQWDEIFRRPHSVSMNPYDPEKHVWVVDDRQHAVYKFSNDGKQLVQTLGIRGEAGTDDRHFNRPTFLAWAPDSTLYVSDGYANTRVVKFDKDGKFLLAWGEKPGSPEDRRPNTFDAVHGVVFDPETRRVYVTDRERHRIQIFDENGKYLDQFETGNPSNPQVLYAAADRHIWVADGTTSKIIKYDMDGRYLYSWGTVGTWPGALWNVHGMSVDSDGNLYLAEVNTGRVEKFIPRPDADKSLMVGLPLRAN